MLPFSCIFLNKIFGSTFDKTFKRYSAPLQNFLLVQLCSFFLKKMFGWTFHKAFKRYSAALQNFLLVQIFEFPDLSERLFVTSQSCREWNMCVCNSQQRFRNNNWRTDAAFFMQLFWKKKMFGWTFDKTLKRYAAPLQNFLLVQLCIFFGKNVRLNIPQGIQEIFCSPPDLSVGPDFWVSRPLWKVICDFAILQGVKHVRVQLPTKISQSP